MAVKTHAQIAAEIAANITDNSNQENTAVRLREVLNDINDSYISVIQTVKVTIPSADVLISNATRYLCIAAPGVGYALEVVSVFRIVEFNSTPYATNTEMQLITDTSTTPQFILSGGLESTIGGARMTPVTISVPATDTQGIENKALYYQTGAGNPTAGDSPVSLYITFRKVAL